MMQPFFAAYFNNLQELHDEIRKIIQELPPEALDWNFGPETNSVTVLVVHVTGAERYWIGDVIAGESSGRNREAEFKAHGWSKDELFQRLDETEKYLQEVLRNLYLPSLDKKHLSPRNGREVTAGWALAHALKHTALHLGHLELTRQLWAQKQTK
jgi:uncharacterized damage-inducible protein DinB